MANLITYSRMAFVVPIGFAITSEAMGTALALFVIAALTDWLDGFVARRTGTVTETGKVMDQMADKVLVISTMTFLVWMGKLTPWVVVAVLWRDIVVSAVRILAAKDGMIIAANVWGKIKTVLQMALVVWILLEVPSYEPLTTFLVWAVIVSTLLSGVVYVYSNRGVFKL